MPASVIAAWVLIVAVPLVCVVWIWWGDRYYERERRRLRGIEEE